MSGSPDVLVIGGGTAGLAAATALAERGAKVRLLEARAGCGGRARSWVDTETGHVEDNGQHVVLGCYDSFFSFLRRIGTDRLLRFQDRLELLLLDPSGGQIRFRLPRLPSPLDLLVGSLGVDGLPLGQVAAAAALALDAGRGGPARGTRTISAWLSEHGQGTEARRLLWDPIVLATVNLRPERACASLLAPVVSRGLLGGPGASRIGTIEAGLSRLIAEPAVHFLLRNHGEVRTSSRVDRIEVSRCGRWALAAVARDGTRHRAGAMVLAVPARPAAHLIPVGSSSFGPSAADRLGNSPIVATHVWLDRVVLDAPMVGFLDSPIHWAFDRGTRAGGADAGYVALITSAAGGMVDLPADRIAETALAELRRFLPSAGRATVRKVRVIKERTATPEFDTEAVRSRPETRTRLRNLVLAGDWVDTGLPATLEGAADSGHRAATALADSRVV